MINVGDIWARSNGLIILVVEVKHAEVRAMVIRWNNSGIDPGTLIYLTRNEKGLIYGGNSHWEKISSFK